ncbi:MAG: sn-glycerol-3-phosphate ABC transporter substrate-binding protein UgpB [Spirochaetales bacterium]|nr:sn-glycerol-3-phosphate ABC transporter substrate-binding protein UgpB [Spirochaetales bacterium]
MKKQVKYILALMALCSVLWANGGGEVEKADAATAQEGPVEIYWWHAMGGALGEKVDQIAADFNAMQQDYQVIPVNKGNYSDTMTAGIAAFRSGEQPHIIQVYEVGTGTMMAAEGAVKPVYKLMEEAGEDFDASAYLSTVTGYYTTPAGEMLSMPFNSSTPIMYYNKDAFAAAGLDPENPPKTWEEVGEVSQILLDKGVVTAGFTTTWPSWIMMENFSAWHNMPIGTKENGFAGKDTEFTFNTTGVVKHHEMMAQWQQENIFKYGGRKGDAGPLFNTAEVAMTFGSSAGYAGYKKNCDFNWGTSTLPYWASMVEEPQNTIIGGASLWVFEGHSQAEYKGVAEFFTYLSSAEVQADWHQFTGYLPITYAAYDLTKSQGFYQENPGTETALLQMTRHEPTANSKGLRFGNYNQIRDIINDAQEAIFSGAKTAQEAMDEAVMRGNELLRQFEETN